MKLAIFLCIIAVANSELIIPPELQEYIDQIHGMCLQKMGLTEDNHKNYNIKDKDQKMMCYMDCLMKTSKWMDTDGTIRYDFILDTAHPQIAHILNPAVNKCREIDTGSMDCEKAYNFNLCLSKADPEHWFLV